MLPLFTVGRKVRKLSRESQDRVADSSGLAGETLNAMQTIQAFTLEWHCRVAVTPKQWKASFGTAVRRNRVRATADGARHRCW